MYNNKIKKQKYLQHISELDVSSTQTLIMGQKRGVGKKNQIIFKPSKSKSKPSKILFFKSGMITILYF